MRDALTPTRALRQKVQIQEHQDDLDSAIRSASAIVTAMDLLSDPSVYPISLNETFENISQAVFSNYYELRGLHTQIHEFNSGDIRIQAGQDQLAYLFLSLLLPFRQHAWKLRTPKGTAPPLELTPVLSSEIDRGRITFNLISNQEIDATEFLAQDGQTTGLGYQLAQQIAHGLNGDVESLFSASGKVQGFSLWLPLTVSPVPDTTSRPEAFRPKDSKSGRSRAAKSSTSQRRSILGAA